jgi:hypothetical protein
MQHLSATSMPMMIIGEDGAVTVTKKFYDNEEAEAAGEFLDPKDLPETVAVVEKDTTKNDWHSAFQGFMLPDSSGVPDAGAFMAVHCSEKLAYEEMHRRAAEVEKLTHDNAMNNPINLASQMYDMMSMYHKKMGY